MGALRSGRAGHVGLVSTNSIRGGANPKVLEPIAEVGAIFEAWNDEPWTIDGAAVRVSLVCFGGTGPAAGRVDTNRAVDRMSRDDETTGSTVKTALRLNGMAVERI